MHHNLQAGTKGAGKKMSHKFKFTGKELIIKVSTKIINEIYKNNSKDILSQFAARATYILFHLCRVLLQI